MQLGSDLVQHYGGGAGDVEGRCGTTHWNPYEAIVRLSRSLTQAKCLIADDDCRTGRPLPYCDALYTDMSDDERRERSTTSANISRR